MHVKVWEALLCCNLRWWIQKKISRQQQTTRKGFSLKCWVSTKALDWEEPFRSPLAAPKQAWIFWAQGHHCVAARASLSEKNQRQPRNKCHFFHFLFLLFPDPVALLTCPPDLITGCERRSSVWIWFPKGKMTYFSQGERLLPEAQRVCVAGKPQWPAVSARASN